MQFSKMTLAAAAGVLALALGAACGGGGDDVPQPSPTTEPSPVIAEGSVAPNVFMTFEGERYRARDVGPDLVTPEEVEVAGTTAEIDIDHAGRVMVYRLMADSTGSLFTFQPGRVTAEEEEGSGPDLWLEWVPEAEGAAPGRLPEAGVSTTTPVGTPYVSEPPIELPFAEMGTVSPVLPGTTPPPVPQEPPHGVPRGEAEDDPSFLPPVTTPPPGQEDPAVR